MTHSTQLRPLVDPHNEHDEETKLGMLEQQLASAIAQNEYWFQHFERLRDTMAVPDAAPRAAWSEIEKEDLVRSALESLSLTGPASSAVQDQSLSLLYCADVFHSFSEGERQAFFSSHHCPDMENWSQSCFPESQ